MTGVHVEIERKYDVGDAFVLPDLSGVLGVASVTAPVEHALEAAYHDTADLRLARARVTLRRRTGGTDAGWHVKLPAAAGARRELHSPLGRAAHSPPRAVLAPVLGIVRSAPVAQVALLRTRRVVTELTDADGRVLAEVADDSVTGTAFPARPGEAAVVTAWREVEVELVAGDEDLLAAVGAALVAAGAEPSRSPSKLTRVLGDRLAALPAAGAPLPEHLPGATGQRRSKKGKHRRSDAGPSPTAGEWVRAALGAAVTGLQDADVQVRTGSPDGAQQLRGACRRLSGLLAASRPVLDRTATDPVRAELAWIVDELAGALDTGTAVRQLRELVSAQPPELVLGPVAARLQQQALRTGPAAHRRAARLLTGPRYLQTLDALAALVADPPLTGRAGEPAAAVAEEVLAAVGKRLRRRVKAARQAGSPDVPDGVRTAVERLRCTAEAAAPVGNRVADLLTGLRGAQQLLDERRETGPTRQLATQLGRRAFAAGENPWTFGRLHGLEEARCRRAEQEFWRCWPALRRATRR